jgi:hypothetical protein
MTLNSIALLGSSRVRENCCGKATLVCRLRKMDPAETVLLQLLDDAVGVDIQ